MNSGKTYEQIVAAHADALAVAAEACSEHVEWLSAKSDLRLVLRDGACLVEATGVPPTSEEYDVGNIPRYCAERSRLDAWARSLPKARPLASDIRSSGPLNRGEQELMGRLADEITGLVCGGICPSMVDVETLARLAARAAEIGGT